MGSLETGTDGQTISAGGVGPALSVTLDWLTSACMERASESQAPAVGESVLKRTLRWLQGPAATGTITAAFSQTFFGYVASTRPSMERWNVDLIVTILALGAFAIAVYIEWHRTGARTFD